MWTRIPALLCCSMLSACAVASTDVVNPVVPRVAVSVVVVTPPSAGPLAPGGTVVLTAAVRDAQGRALGDRVVAWASSSATVASVSSAGLVTAVGPGVATIAATSEGVSGSATVSVRPPASKVVVTSATATLLPQATVTLSASVLAADGTPLTGRPVIWTSTNPSVATVSTAGVVTAIAVGEVLVSATAEGVTGSAALTVRPPVASVVVNPTAVTLFPGQRQGLTATARAADGAALPGVQLTWTSMNPTVATVSTTGAVEAVSPGVATVTATGGAAVGTATITVTPLPVQGYGIGRGYKHTCAIAVTQTAYCWGGNGYVGMLGDGTDAPRGTPGPVSGGLEFVSLNAGGYGSCALTKFGKAYCWGANWNGQLGVGSLQQGTTVPVPVWGDLVFTQLYKGEDTTCGLTPDGWVYCWGENSLGTVGIGPSTTDQQTPVRVSGARTFVALANGAGGRHVCALASDGGAWCWGASTAGALGNGTFDERRVPTPVVGAPAFAQLPVGTNHSCGRTPAGAAYCWGSSRVGQRGDGSVTDKLGLPVPVSGAIAFARLFAYDEVTCGLTVDGTAYCWGLNDFGQLGDGTTTNRSVPTAVAGGLKFVALAVGPGTNCGIETNGKSYCWGANTDGKLGNGESANSAVPVLVAGGTTYRAIP